MENRTQNNGLQTFREHWGLPLTAVIAVLCSKILDFFFNLKGPPWIYFFVVSMILLFSGGALIAYAKMPVYRSGRFFTFGIKSVPERLVPYYRWGWRVFLFGVVLSLCLLLSKP